MTETKTRQSREKEVEKDEWKNYGGKFLEWKFRAALQLELHPLRNIFL